MDINYILNSLLVTETNSLGLIDIVITIVLPFILSLFIAWFYKKSSTHGNYSSDFIYALLLFSSLTAIITLLIGSNIARAFGLVAALSLIRFRTALKSALDGIYLFWTLAVGMACGVGFYMAAILIVLLGIMLMWLSLYFRIGENRLQTVILKIRFNHKNQDVQNECLELLSREVRGIEHLNRYMNSSQNWIEQVYSISIEKTSDPFELRDKLMEKELINVEIFSSEMALFS